MPRPASHPSLLSLHLVALVALVALISPAAYGQGFAGQQTALTGPAQEEPTRTPPIRYVLTISGGISLGAYEAGFNWALLRYLKKHRAETATPGPPLAPLELVAATGASAGNINAFLTAVGWCQTTAYDDRETPSENLFWRAWVPIGVEDLFLGPGGKYQADDGLFTRNAFNDIKRELATAAGTAGRFTPDCKLPVGITITRNRLGNIVLNDTDGTGPGLQIATQRFVVALDARASKAGLTFHERPRACDDPAVGQYLHLPGAEGQAIPVETVLGLVEASSAFPMAFGPKAIRHCLPGAKGDPQCTVHPEVPGTDSFFDGGVFDNVPLGLGVSLALPRTPRACPAKHDTGDIEFLYVDPDRRRRGPSVANVATATATANLADEAGPQRGLSSALDFIENFILVSRQYELQTAARYVFDRLFKEDLQRASGAEVSDLVKGRQKSTHDARLRLTSRFFPLVGRYLGAFGAFFAQSFRQYDFYVGIYDALFGVAEASCRRGSPDAAAQARCITTKVLDLERQLGMTGPASAGANYVVHELLRAEVAAWLPQSNAGAANVTAKVSFIDPAAPPAGISLDMGGQLKVMAALVRTSGELEREEVRVHDTHDAKAVARFHSGNTFVAFVERFRNHLGDLDAPGVQQQFQAPERRLVEDPDAEMRVILASAAERQAEIEEAENFELGTRAMALTQMVLYSEPFRPSKGLDLDPSSIPDRRLTGGRAVTHVLPYSVSGDLLNGGTNIEYRPAYWFFERAGIGLPFSPVVWQSAQGGRMLAAAGAAFLLHLDSVFLPELQFGARFTHSWRGLADGAYSDIRPGCELAAYLLAGKLRLSVGIDDFTQLGETHHAWSIKLGLADVNGLLYWAGRFLGG